MSDPDSSARRRRPKTAPTSPPTIVRKSTSTARLSFAASLAIFLFALIGLVFIIGPLVMKFAFDFKVPGLVLLILILIGAVIIAIPIIKLKTITYRISNYRIDYERRPAVEKHRYAGAVACGRCSLSPVATRPHP